MCYGSKFKTLVSDCAKNACFLSDGFFTNTKLLKLTLGRNDTVQTPAHLKIEFKYIIHNEISEV